MLEIRTLKHCYGERTVLSMPEFRLDGGQIIALVGPNGSGKSTLLRLLAAVERPTSGTILLDGQPITTEAARRSARQAITLVEQKPLLFNGTVEQNLRSALSFHGTTGVKATARVDRSLARVDAVELAPRDVRRLSDGEIQRVAIARALALEPRVLLLDEPTAAADRQSTARLYRELERERERGAAICFASHQLEDAYRWADDLLALEGGRLSPATPENLFKVSLPDGDGAKTVSVGPLDVHVVTDIVGPATIGIPPADITVSRTTHESSARNQFRGTIVRISDDRRGRVSLVVDVGIEITARVTPDAVVDLQVGVGSEVVLSCKAVAVRVF